MPGLTVRKGPAVSLVQDQDIVLTTEPGLSDLTITIIGTICKKSPYLKALLDATNDKTELTFGGDAESKNDGENKEGTLIWLTQLHELSEQRSDELGLFDISLVGVWHAISMWNAHQDGNIKEKLVEWFNKWYEKNMAKANLTVPIAQALAYPCYIFDHAVGYARVTRYLAYEHVGHVKERPPKGFKGPKHRHINERMFVVDDVLNYSSIGQVVRRLKTFDYAYTPKCNRCRSIDWETIVLKALSNTLGYFNGMCLDCMDRSKPRGDNLDDEYAKHNQSVGGRWDTQCRIKHGQPTWYISWLGRPDMREKILRGPDGYRRPEEE
ncbi:uncharacterized protein ALTATR162_LOCUS9863 [Alternaria atra]|uniref:Uncharacterized protein n=1 Tax=Alternaria atra TaxID=119953 RepID=A0A8J2ID35_9PLEO|nr:uncharacterized protein ALTATR162_LOCUS9863 [Alternaria atra]CAG5181843.1 unnamed protein product [Alternaria atra]